MDFSKSEYPDWIWSEICLVSAMKRLLYGFGFFALSLVYGFQTMPAGDTNAKLKTVFIYNFTRYIEWPTDYKTGNFEITMFGSNTAMLTELNNMSKTKKVGTQTIDIHNTTSLDGIGKCNILYISADVTNPLSEIIAKVKGKATLIVTEKPGCAKQGSAINFIVVDSRQKFELNQTNAEKYNLKVSSSLVALAIPVE